MNNIKSLQLSIIMPVYNPGKYLIESLNSILNINDITYEIICIDDGSTDNSYKILLEYQKKFPHLNIISVKNKGPYYCRNIGLSLASGKYIQFIDADDYINPKMINQIIAYLDNYNLDIISISGKADKNGKISTYNDFEYKNIPDFLINKPLDSYKFKDYFYFLEGYVCLHIYNREFINKINNKFSLEKNYSDFLFFQSALVQSKKYAIYKIYIYYYRQWEGQSTKNHNVRYFSYLNIQKKVFDLYFLYFGRQYALKYLNYFTQYFEKHSQWIEDKYKDEYKYALSHFYDYCLNKTIE